MTSFSTQPGGRQQGQATVPGGKSNSYRAVMLTAITDGI